MSKVISCHIKLNFIYFIIFFLLDLQVTERFFGVIVQAKSFKLVGVKCSNKWKTDFGDRDCMKWIKRKADIDRDFQGDRGTFVSAYFTSKNLSDPS